MVFSMLLKFIKLVFIIVIDSVEIWMCLVDLLFSRNKFFRVIGFRMVSFEKERRDGIEFEVIFRYRLGEFWR